MTKIADKPSDGISPLLNVQRAGQYLGLSARTLNSWRSAGKGPRYVKMGGLVYYRTPDLETWISSRVVDPETPIQEGAR